MRAFFKPFFSAEDGVVAPTVALMFAALIAAVGASTDYARAQLVQAKLSDTLDAAGLAAGATINSADPRDAALNYFSVNFPASYMQSSAALTGVTQNATKTTLTLTATATVPTVFMQMMGIDSIPVSATTEITRKSSGLELALVMDNTGSMAGTKIASVITDAQELTNILFGDDETRPDLWIGLVPFSQAVNVGPTRSNWVNSTYKALDWGPSGSSAWAGCVNARVQSGEDITDDPPGTTLFDAYYWPSDSTNKWKTTTVKKGKTTTTYKTFTPTLGPNAYCPQQVQIMSNDKATVLAGIGTMQARGNTHIDLGAVWGWRMLSPRWRGVWGGTMDANNLPLDYSTPYMEKAVVIMTDGDNTMSSSIFTAYGYLSQAELGTTNATTAVQKLDSDLTAVCTAMKSHGIKIYTILFDVAAGDTNAINLLQGCATEPDYFFNSPTEADLEVAFQQIGDSLSNLRINK